MDLNIPAPVITLALQQRLRSREQDPFTERLLAMMRNKFGGHDVKRES
jgi:6-phosphogluconate dehydrogenase